jgi:FkbM family methyltransferase
MQMSELLTYPLTQESLVWDVGAYRGEFACAAIEKYRCQVVAFEPMLIYVPALRARLNMLTDRYEVMPYGLLDRNLSTTMPLAGDSSSLYKEAGAPGPSMPATFRDITGVIQERDPKRIDLMKINIEGAEYPVLRRLLDAGDLSRIHRLLVQFHTFVPDYEALYEAIAADLAKTHSPSWRNPWVWEAWEAKSVVQRTTNHKEDR